MRLSQLWVGLHASRYRAARHPILLKRQRIANVHTNNCRSRSNSPEPAPAFDIRRDQGGLEMPIASLLRRASTRDPG